jgi:thiol-disulfide isomerase/thioredoxin
MVLFNSFTINFTQNIYMKKLFLVGLVAVVSFTSAKAQASFTTTVDDKNVTILKGIIVKDDIATNAAFAGWYGGNQTSYKTDTSVTNAMAAAKDKVQYVVFGGTWCEDTQFILPKFFKLQEQSGVQENSISLYAVDRSKTTIGNIANAFKITNVPTIIVMKDGKEIGRVVEYGKTGKWDTELGALLKGL